MKSQTNESPAPAKQPSARKNKAADSFSFSFSSSKSPEHIYETLLDIKSWWKGLYAETITGASSKLNDEFSFSAGGGAHNTTQKLVEMVPGKRIVWLVTQSNLTFLDQPDEWTNTKISFDISSKGDKTEVRFTHEGLVPQNECYENCTSAWTQYLQLFSEKLK